MTNGMVSCLRAEDKGAVREVGRLPVAINCTKVSTIGLGHCVAVEGLKTGWIVDNRRRRSLFSKFRYLTPPLLAISSASTDDRCKRHHICPDRAVVRQKSKIASVSSSGHSSGRK